MINISKIPSKRLHERHEVPMRARIASKGAGGEEGKNLECTIQDISLCGASLMADVNLNNDQFIDLFIDNVGQVPGQVRRSYEGGFGVELMADDEQQGKIKEEIEKFRKTMKEGGGRA